MAILDLLVPGRAKSALRRDLEDIHMAAGREPERQGMQSSIATAWIALSDGAFYATRQLLVDGSDKAMDWGLKRHRRNVNRVRLAAVYWWSLLYQMVLFRSRGLNDHGPEVEFSELAEGADAFMEHLASWPDHGGLPVPPWDPAWQSQVSLEAALGMYGAIVGLLRLYDDPETRAIRVSLFTSATERHYDSVVKAEMANAEGAEGDT